MASSRPLDGQVGIVTGGGKGLGRAFALDLASAGARVVVNNRNREVDDAGLGPADRVVAEIRAAGGEAVAEHSDVTDPAAAQSMLDLALDTWGRLDFLVANAAVSMLGMFHKSTTEIFDSVNAINVGGTAHIALLCTQHMRGAGAGRIVLVASTAGLHGETAAAAYTASKGAVIALGRVMATEGERRNVFTNVVLPYATTQMTDNGMHPQYRDIMTAEAVAPIVTALVDPGCTLNDQVLVAAAGALRAAAAVEYGTVMLPATLTPNALADCVAESRRSAPREYPDAMTGFREFASEIVSARA